MQTLTPVPLTKTNFKLFGEVIELKGRDPISINSGNCVRYSDLATVDISSTGAPGISIFDAKPYSNPITLNYVERHPLGSQAFIPTSNDPYLVIVAHDLGAVAQEPHVFITDGNQGVSYYRNTWHGVLTPIIRQGLFVVIDYIGGGDNLDEYEYTSPYLIDYELALHPRSR